MLRTYPLFAVSAAFLISMVVAGCTGSAVNTNSASDAKSEPVTKQDAGNLAQDTASSKTDSVSHLAELSAEDRALAEKQQICPVSGQKLGAMGKPYKVILNGRTVFLCCESCEADLKKDPDKYLAKLSK
jgi:YHS domain-containing protein